MEASLDRIRAWEQSTGGFLNVGNRIGDGSGGGVPF